MAAGAGMSRASLYRKLRYHGIHRALNPGAVGGPSLP
jgi:hypothetical protein